MGILVGTELKPARKALFLLNLVSFKNIGLKTTNLLVVPMPIYGHKIFGHNSPIFYANLKNYRISVIRKLIYIITDNSLSKILAFSSR